MLNGFNFSKSKADLRITILYQKHCNEQLGSFESDWKMDLPIPLLAPVMTATRPVRSLP